MKAIPIDAADNEMDGCIHILKDAYMKNSAQEFIRMLSPVSYTHLDVYKRQ